MHFITIIVSTLLLSGCLFLPIVVAVHAAEKGQENIDWILGNYKGTVGTRLTVDCVGAQCCSPFCTNISFTGTFTTLFIGEVMDFKTEIIGMVNPSLGFTKTGSIAFIANWRYIDIERNYSVVISTMAWNGVVRSVSNVNTMYTKWMMTSTAVTVLNGWDATSIGYDVYTKND